MAQGDNNLFIATETGTNTTTSNPTPPVPEFVTPTSNTLQALTDNNSLKSPLTNINVSIIDFEFN